MRTFAENVVHVIDDNVNFLEAAEGKKPGGYGRFTNLKTRAEILKALDDQWEYGKKILAEMTETQAMETVAYGDMPRWRLIMAAVGHAKEHYGNLVTYMRLNGLVPPATAAQQRR